MELFLKRTKNVCDAVCEYKNDVFIVKKGSTISKNDSYDKMSKEARSYRNDSKKVKNYITLEDLTFKSSTSAAQFVTGQSVNGNKAWRDKDGKTFGSIKKK